MIILMIIIIIMTHITVFTASFITIPSKITLMLLKDSHDVTEDHESNTISPMQF